MTSATRPRTASRALAAAAVAVLLSACGLPVESGVRSPGPVAPEAVERGGIQVLPPGPRPDAGPREVVLGFLGAQTSPDADYALAREFLAPEVRGSWDSGTGVVIYDPVSVEVVTDVGDDSLVVVRSDTVASIGADGGYQLETGSVEDTYRLARDASGQLQLVDVPSGLRLTPAGAGRSYRAEEVYFVGLPEGPGPSERLVPDRAFLPAQGELADHLVRQLLAGPTVALGDAVTTGFPVGTALHRPVEPLADGVATVDLTREVLAAGPAQRRQLSAQVGWTLQTALPATSGIRLLVEGEPLEVPEAEELQDRSDWLSVDPNGAAGRAPALYVVDRRLQRLEGSTPRSEATDGTLPVDAVAVSPSTGRLALLTRDGDPGTADVVRVGPSSGPFAPVLQDAPVSSLSWGSGARGLWAVTTAPDPAADSAIVLVPSSADVQPLRVPYARPPGAGPLSVLRVSRDGARVAAVFGIGAERRLYVGRVELGDGGLRLAGLRPVAPLLADVADVAWESGTSLVVLAPLGTPNRLPVRVTVDGSELEPVRTLGLDGEPETVTAAPGRPLVVGTVLAGRPVLLVEDGELFRLQPGAGAAPAYPG
ncbi:MAG TPA: LpqB family beta-propeller domain-containing protein [Mycobacteriales bacterium]|nr:LpqB family beta-propeller domain-containing protein [Mycobacteriales bacterium]